MSFISTSIDQISEMTKPQKKFVQWIFEKWIMLPVRHNFLNLFRYSDGAYCEKSIRHQFSPKFNFGQWFDTVLGELGRKECIVAFDPSYIPKSGKKTYGKGYFWSGKGQRRKPGLEIGRLAMVDVNRVDKRRWKRCYEDAHVIGFELIVKCVTLKRIVNKTTLLQMLK